MIELSGLTKTYAVAGERVIALDQINLHVKVGEIFGIVGRSGAGKSSLIRCINLLERPSAGKVWIDKKELTALSEKKLREIRHKIGMIFQHFNLLSTCTVYENIALPLQLLSYSAKDIEQRVLSLLELIGLSDKKNYYPAQLSGGQKQRVGIARALATHPKVLLCDEATSSLDPQMTKSILDLLKQINREFNLTIVLITHEMEVLKSICDSVALLEKGKVIEQGNIVNFFVQPQTDVARELVNDCLRQELPSRLQERLSTEQHPPHRLPLLRLSFQGSVAAEPLIAHLIRNVGLMVNILQANIETIREHTIGIVVIEVTENLSKLDQGIAYLREKGVHVEIIGYVT